MITGLDFFGSFYVKIKRTTKRLFAPPRTR